MKEYAYEKINELISTFLEHWKTQDEGQLLINNNLLTDDDIFLIHL